MQLHMLLLAGLALATASSAADSLVTTTACPSVGACDSRGVFTTKYGKYSIDANKSCRTPPVPAMTRLCMDWGKGRAHFYFKNQGKRCMKKGPDRDVGPCGDSSKKCSRQTWDEVSCTW